MTIDNRRIATVRLVPLLLAFSFLVAACGQSAAPSATVTPPPTAAPPTATTAPSPTAAPPTATTAPSPTAAPTSTPLPETDLDIDLPEGNPERGKSRAIQVLCAACHIRGARGPDFIAGQGLPRMLERGEVRIADPAYEGSASTNREYLIESIRFPDVYVVPGNWPEPMPTDFGERLTDQDLADILAWLDTFE
jgi:mono/diheme cytochrome c family protein